MELHLPGHRGAAVSDRGHAGVLVAEMANPSPDPITMLILGGACAALVEVAEFIVWSNDRRRARQHPSPYAGLADDELSPLDPGGQRAASPCACYGFVTSGCLDSMSWLGLPFAKTFGHVRRNVRAWADSTGTGGSGAAVPDRITERRRPCAPTIRDAPAPTRSTGGRPVTSRSSPARAGRCSATASSFSTTSVPCCLRAVSRRSRTRRACGSWQLPEPLREAVCMFPPGRSRKIPCPALN